MKRKTFLISLLVLFLLVFGVISNAKASDFKIGIHENDELIWECKVCNKAEMILIFGNEWDNSGVFQNLSRGTRMKWEINTVEINEEISKIEYSVWYWTLNKNWSVKDKDLITPYYTNPNDYAEGLNFINYTSLVPFWFPIPVGDYMGGLKLNVWYDVDNRVLPTLNVNIPMDAIWPDYPNKGIEIIAIYNDEGILSSYKLYINENVVIVDIALDFLPFYVIPTLIVLFTVLSLVAIVYIIKKYKSIRLSTPNLK